MLSIPQQGERTMSKQKKNKKPDWLKTTWQMKQTLRQSKYIEDTLNDVFSRHMPDLQPGEELGMGFGKERILNEVNYVDCENKELKEIWMDDELGKADPEVQKRLMEIMEIMLTRKIKPKGETMSKQAEELWASDFHGKEYIKSMKASDRAELLELMVTRKWGETK